MDIPWAARLPAHHPDTTAHGDCKGSAHGPFSPSPPPPWSKPEASVTTATMQPPCGSGGGFLQPCSGHIKPALTAFWWALLPSAAQLPCPPYPHLRVSPPFLPLLEQRKYVPTSGPVCSPHLNTSSWGLRHLISQRPSLRNPPPHFIYFYPSSFLMAFHFLQLKISHLFPGRPVVKTSSSSAGAVGLLPGQRVKISHAKGPKKKKARNRSNIVINSIKT